MEYSDTAIKCNIVYYRWTTSLVTGVKQALQGCYGRKDLTKVKPMTTVMRIYSIQRKYDDTALRSRCDTVRSSIIKMLITTNIQITAQVSKKILFFKAIRIILKKSLLIP